MNFLDGLLKKAALNSINVHVTEAYLVACLWNVNYEACLLEAKLLCQTTKVSTVSCDSSLAAC